MQTLLPEDSVLRVHSIISKMILGISEYPNLGERVSWFSEPVKGNLGKLTDKPLPQKKNEGQDHRELSQEESNKTLSVCSTLHLLLHTEVVLDVEDYGFINFERAGPSLILPFLAL